MSNPLLPHAKPTAGLTVALVVTLALTACARASAGRRDAQPVPLTEAVMAGTWGGALRDARSDAVIGNIVDICADGVCKGVMNGSTDTVFIEYRLAGDSSIGVSRPFNARSKKGMRLQDRWVARVRHDTLFGVGATHLAGRPDSVVMRFRFAATRQRGGKR